MHKDVPYLLKIPFLYQTSYVNRKCPWMEPNCSLLHHKHMIKILSKLAVSSFWIGKKSKNDATNILARNFFAKKLRVCMNVLLYCFIQKNKKYTIGSDSSWNRICILKKSKRFVSKRLNKKDCLKYKEDNLRSLKTCTFMIHIPTFQSVTDWMS